MGQGFGTPALPNRARASIHCGGRPPPQVAQFSPSKHATNFVLGVQYALDRRKSSASNALIFTVKYAKFLGQFLQTFWHGKNRCPILQLCALRHFTASHQRVVAVAQVRSSAHPNPASSQPPLLGNARHLTVGAKGRCQWRPVCVPESVGPCSPANPLLHRPVTQLRTLSPGAMLLVRFACPPPPHTYTPCLSLPTH